MSSELKPPIILLGNTRSGTTIVQKVVCTHSDLEPWYEPRTLWLYADPARRHDEFDESDATGKVKRYIRKRFLKFQKQHGDRVVLEKTPANILKIPYVRAIFPEATYLFMVRSPFSFIHSVEMKWQRTLSAEGIIRRLRCTPVTQLHHYAGRLIGDQFRKRVLGQKYMAVWGPRYRGMDEDVKTHDLLTVIARQWSRCSRKAEEDLARFAPGEVLRLRYEDFVENPVADLERICMHCRLTLTSDMVRAANEWVKSDRQFKWRRFDPGDLRRLLPELTEEMERHGYEVPSEVAQAMEPAYAEIGS
jgi:hypothetical protein